MVCETRGILIVCELLRMPNATKSFRYLRNFFPNLSAAKVEAGVFIGPQIRKIMDCPRFPQLLTATEQNAWNSFKAVVHGVLGNNREENANELVSKLVANFHLIGCNMSLKVHMLHSHFDNFKHNLGAYSEEQGERFHKDIMDFEKKYQGQYNESMMRDYIWGLVRDSDCSIYNRKAKRIHF
jgi:hypothetical protein